MSYFGALVFLLVCGMSSFFFFFFFNAPATTEIYPLSLHDALPIFWQFGVQVPLIFSAYSLAESLSTAGTGFAFVIGLGWAVWAVDRQTKRTPPPLHQPAWNPFWLLAWYFGKKNQKLRQSILTLAVYSFLFMAAFFILNGMTDRKSVV